MAAEFWFKFYFKDWRSDTILLSTEEKGLLIELIIYMRENNGECPIDIRLINRLTEITTDNLKIAIQTFREKNIFDFETKEGKEYFISRKIKKEIHKSIVNKENGSKGGNPNLINSDNQINKISVKRKANRISNSISNSDSNNKSKEENVENFDFKTSMLDYGFDAILIDRWMKVRKKLKAVNSDVAFEGFIREVSKSNQDKNYILRKCVEKSWKGFESIWLDNSSRNEKNTKSIAL